MVVGCKNFWREFPVSVASRIKNILVSQVWIVDTGEFSLTPRLLFQSAAALLQDSRGGEHGNGRQGYQSYIRRTEKEHCVDGLGKRVLGLMDPIGGRAARVADQMMTGSCGSWCWMGGTNGVGRGGECDV
jgi:hypothetical protein